MKTTFNYVGDSTACANHVALFIIMLLASSVYADVAVNKSEKDDKINNTSLLQKAAEVNQDVTGSNAVTLGSNASKVLELRAEQWELARSGESILGLPVLNQLINSWLLDRRKKIELRYPGGEEGEFWVQELTDWMVSLGISSNHIITIPGSGAGDKIKFLLVN